MGFRDLDDALAAARTGSPGACLFLANRYAGLEAHPADILSTVREYINDAETSGDSESYFRAGMGIIESRDLVGRGVDGVAYLRAAAKRGHWLAQNNLAVIFGNGLYGEAQNNDECTNWMLACIENPSYIDGLAGRVIYPNNTAHWMLIDRACYWYEQAAAGGSSFGMLAMALMLGGHKSTGGEAARWLLRASRELQECAWLVSALMHQISKDHPLSSIKRPVHIDVLAAIAAGRNNGSSSVLDELRTKK